VPKVGIITADGVGVLWYVCIGVVVYGVSRTTKRKNDMSTLNTIPNYVLVQRDKVNLAMGKAWHLKENMNEEEEKKKEIWKCGGLSRKFQHNEQIRRQSRL